MPAAKLPYSVECKSIYPFFEKIAAFDCEPPAKRYAMDCARGHRSAEYRVVKAKKVLGTYRNLLFSKSA